MSAPSRVGCPDFRRTLDRRSFVRAGVLGGLSLGGLLKAETPRSASTKSVILLWMRGGPSHIDMWDLKPGAPSEFRGTFNPIRTNLNGLQVAEHMPRIAKICDKIAVVRSCTHPDSGHESASHQLLTGYKIGRAHV